MDHSQDTDGRAVGVVDHGPLEDEPPPDLLTSEVGARRSGASLSCQQLERLYEPVVDVQGTFRAVPIRDVERISARSSWAVSVSWYPAFNPAAPRVAYASAAWQQGRRSRGLPGRPASPLRPGH